MDISYPESMRFTSLGPLSWGCLLCDCAEILHCELTLSLPSEASPIIILLTHVLAVVALPTGLRAAALLRGGAPGL